MVSRFFVDKYFINRSTAVHSPNFWESSWIMRYFSPISEGGSSTALGSISVSSSSGSRPTNNSGSTNEYSSPLHVWGIGTPREIVLDAYGTMPQDNTKNVVPVIPLTENEIIQENLPPDFEIRDDDHLSWKDRTSQSYVFEEKIVDTDFLIDLEITANIIEKQLGNGRIQQNFVNGQYVGNTNYLPVEVANLTYTRTSFTIKAPLSPVSYGVNAQGYAIQNIPISRNTSITIKARPNTGAAALVAVSIGVSILFPPIAPVFILAPAF